MKKLLVGAAALALLVPTATASAEQYADLPGATGLTQYDVNQIAKQKPVQGQPGAVFTPNTGTNVDTNGFQYEMKNVKVTSTDGVNARLTGTAAGAFHISGPQGVGGHYEYAEFPVDVKVTHKDGKVYDKNGNLVYLPSSTQAAPKAPKAPVAGPVSKPAVKAAVAKAKSSAKTGAKTLPKTSAAK